MISRRLLFSIVTAAALALPACSTMQSIGTAVGVASQPVNMVELSKKSAQARVAYLGFLKLATVYMTRPRCGAPTSPAVCSSQAFIDNTLVPTRIAFGEATFASEAAVARVGESPTLIAVLVEAAVSSSRAAAEIATQIGGK